MTTDGLFWFSGALLGITGVLLALWALFGDRSRGRRRCPKCWYDMSGTDGLRCSECGKEVKSPRKLYKTQHRWKWVFVSILLIIFSIVLSVFPDVRHRGWDAYVPSTALIHMIGVADSEWAFDAVAKRTQFVVEISGDDRRWFTDHEQYFRSPRSDILSQHQWNLFREQLISVIRDSSNNSLKKKALYALGTYELVEESSGPVLVRAVQDDDEDVQRLAIAALCHVSVRQYLCDHQVIIALEKLCESDKHSTQYVALRALSYCGLNNDRIRIVFKKALDSENQITRSSACSVLDNRCSTPELALEYLLRMVDDSDTGVRMMIINSLGSIDGFDQVTLPAILIMAHDDHDSVRSEL